MFRALLELARARHIRTQTNDPLLLVMLYDCGANITPDNVLFADGFTSSLTCPRGALKRGKDTSSRICYEMGKIPAARCNADNAILRRTLEKAGRLPCARVLQGDVVR